MYLSKGRGVYLIKTYCISEFVLPGFGTSGYNYLDLKLIAV